MLGHRQVKGVGDQCDLYSEHYQGVATAFCTKKSRHGAAHISLGTTHINKMQEVVGFINSKNISYIYRIIHNMYVNKCFGDTVAEAMVADS